MPAEPSQPLVVRRATRDQDALRLLFTLDACGTPAVPGRDPPEAVAVVHSQMKLQALDFWMRNPDYLANELLTEYETSKDASFLHAARAILESDEPDLRRYPMVRYLYGAYEPLDDALSVLRAPELISIQRHGNPAQGVVTEHVFYLLRRGRETIARILSDYPDLSWYSDRSQLVAKVAGSTPGSRLKERQYKQIEYESTRLTSRIGSITEKVKAKLQTLSRV